MAGTIFALSSGAGHAGIAVIRVSGPAAAEVARNLTDRPTPPARVATRAKFADPASRDVLDDGLILWFPGPASFTGEDVAEFHVHGGPAVIAGMIDVLDGISGLRIAEPGEFTRRAFENGKLDLTAVEGLADLINAETAAQRRQAQRQLAGELATLYDGWREELIRACALMEAAIDFSDEELPAGLAEESREIAMRIASAITGHLDDGRRGERLRDGVSIAILGPPNAGKSSLLNWLARREAAIVSAEAGTTRDIVEVRVDVAGYPAILADTAGLREVEGEVESEGIRRARARAEHADLNVILLDGAVWPDVDPGLPPLIDDRALVAVNKSDTSGLVGTVEVAGRPALAVSVLTGFGMDRLVRALEERVAGLAGLSEAPALTRARHRAALTQSLEALERAAVARAAELAAEDLRLAARALGRITGRVDVEDLLDRIFSEFCIGK